MEKIDYVVLLPGDPSSINQAMFFHRTMINMAQQEKKFTLIPQKGNNIYTVRNWCLSPPKRPKSDDSFEMDMNYSLEQKPFEGLIEDYEKIIWVDSDNFPTFPILTQLLSHDLDIVAAWYIVPDMGGLNQKTSCGLGILSDDRKGWKAHRNIHIDEIPLWPRTETGLIEVDWSGFGLMVMKRGVCEAIGYPWFEGWKVEWEEDGIKMARIMDDDEGFCFRAKEKGFRIFVDPECKIVHEKKAFL